MLSEEKKSKNVFFLGDKRRWRGEKPEGTKGGGMFVPLV